MDDDLCLYPSTLSTGFHQFSPVFGRHGLWQAQLSETAGLAVTDISLPVFTGCHQFLPVFGYHELWQAQPSRMADLTVTDKFARFYRFSPVFTCFWPSRIVASSTVTNVSNSLISSSWIS